MRNYRVTGPVDVPKQTLEAMTEPMISHRSWEFRERLTSVMQRLGQLFGTSGIVLPLTCSGTGGLEAAVTSVLRLGDRVLSVQLGYFGERFAQIASHFGVQVDAVVPQAWGQGVEPGAIAAKLSTAAYDAVLLTHNETSTGMLSPLHDWIAAIRSVSDPLILADVVSSLAATEIAFDELGLDIAVGVTQKALACPPGMALIAASERAMSRAGEPGAIANYLSLSEAARHAREGTTPYTPALSLVFALDAALTAIEEEGIRNSWQRHASTASHCRDAVAGQGLQVIPAYSWCSPTVTAVGVPGGHAQRVRQVLAGKYDVWVSSGRAAWKDTALRIGHMGPVRPEDIDLCAAAMRNAVRDVNGV